MEVRCRKKGVSDLKGYAIWDYDRENVALLGQFSTEHLRHGKASVIHLERGGCCVGLLEILLPCVRFFILGKKSQGRRVEILC